jgi:hypothetical protein
VGGAGMRKFIVTADVAVPVLVATAACGTHTCDPLVGR